MRLVLFFLPLLFGFFLLVPLMFCWSLVLCSQLAFVGCILAVFLLAICLECGLLFVILWDLVPCILLFLLAGFVRFRAYIIYLAVKKNSFLDTHD
jgi:hypothetical protein